VPFWWSFDLLLGNEERQLGQVMRDAFFSFSNCNNDSCVVGGTGGSLVWPVYSSVDGNRNIRTRLHTPTYDIHTEPDDEFDGRCAFFEKVMGEIEGTIVGNCPPDSPVPGEGAPVEQTSLGRYFDPLQRIFQDIIRKYSKSDI
jgi:hypothetical protein